MRTQSGKKIFFIPKGEKILLGAVVINLVILSMLSISNTRISNEQSKSYKSALSKSTSIIYAERETLAFTLKYAQWIGGQIPKREVLIAKALLAQRLYVVNEDGKRAVDFISDRFRKKLTGSDPILDSAPEGKLSETKRIELSKEATSFIAELVRNSRKVLVDSQLELDNSVLIFSSSNEKNSRQSLLALLSFIVLVSLLVVWGAVSFKNANSLAKKTLEEEEEALLRSQAMLKDSEATIKKLEELDITKSDFISTVNHELRTPLTSIIGYIDVLKTLDIEKDADQLPQITTVIVRNSEVLLDIIESILWLSSLDSTAQEPRFESTGLIEIIDRKIFVLTPIITQKSIVVNFHHDYIDDFVVFGNAGQLSQVVLNLLSNAIKFSPNASTLDISLSVISKNRPQDFIQLEVRDQGVGIPKDEIPNLFTRFFRASNAISSQISGTGLGLAIVGRILDLHQASIRIESEINKGSSFIVEFPRHLTETQQFVSNNRSAVLVKAIVALKAGERDELIAISHQMSGTLGFYNLEEEMQLIADFQRWLESSPSNLDELVDSKKTALVNALESSYSVLNDGMDRQQ